MRAAHYVRQEDGARVWRALDQTCRRGASEGVAPGIVVLAGNSREILFHRAYGCRALVPTRLPMRPDTVFDVASLTKPVVTTTSMMLLVRDGLVGLDDPVSTVVPEFSDGAKSAVTFRQLLNHTSGLPAWKPYYENTPLPLSVISAPLSVIPASLSIIPAPPLSVIPAKAGIQGRMGERRLGDPTPLHLDSRFRGNDGQWGGNDGQKKGGGNAGKRGGGASEGRGHEATGRGHIFARVHSEPLAAAPGEKACYSDLGFILLGEVVERLTGKRLDRFCHDEIFAPLGLASTFFVDVGPPSGAPHPKSVHTLAATEDCPWRGKILCGEVHDDNAFAMGGVAGHAGLFSSAPDIHRFLRFLGRCRDGAEPDFLPGAVVREFLEAERPLPGQTHVLGWDTPSPEGSSSGACFSARTVGHLGFTGTSIWWDMERDVHVILLTNRVHPSRDNDVIREFRPRVHDAAMEALFS